MSKSKPPTAPTADSSAKEFDPLLTCLAFICQKHHLAFNEDAVIAGLPLDGSRRLAPVTILRAARRCGLEGKVVKRKIKKLSSGVAPAILLLKNGDAAVLDSLGETQEDSTATLHLPRTDGATDATGLETLGDRYTGYAILFQPAPADLIEENSPKAAGCSQRPEFDDPKARRHWFWKMMWRFRGYYSQLLPGSLLINLFAVAMPFFIMIVYDRVVPNDAVETLWVLAIGVGLVFVFEYLIRLVRGLIIERAGKEIDQVLASSLFEQLLAIEMKSRPASASVLTGRMKAYETLREFFMSASMLAIADLPFGLLMMLVIFYIGGPIGWVLVVAAVTAIGVELLIQGPLRKSVTRSVNSGVERQAFISETVNGIETVKGCNAEGVFQKRLETMMRQASGSEVKSHWFGLFGNSTTTFLIHLTSVAVVVFSVYRVGAGEMTMGAMIACVMLASRCMAPITMVAGLMTRLQHALEALSGLNQIMNLSRETGDGRDFVQKNGVRNHYQLRAVKARYPDQSIPALDGIDLEICPGEKVAVLGKIGSGKSTLLRVMAKLYQCEEGEILLDGIDLSQYHPSAVRQVAGYLPQDATLFEGTLRENLILGAGETSDDGLFAALRMAGLAETVRRHPKGIHLPVGERGIMLSGGQRQAAALARALVNRPKMLLLDEPTAAMDLNSERLVKTALHDYLAEDRDRSLVLVTHKTSMLDLVDRILVIDQGKLIADGPREKVLEKMRKPGKKKAAASDKTNQISSVNFAAQS